MSHNEAPRQVDDEAAQVPLLEQDAEPAAIEGWARQVEVVPTPPISFGRAVRVHVASR